jgi:HD-like signal output (HDOD) protein
MRRILFVDDEAPVLHALRLRLRPMQGKWDMTFLDSGARAVAELECNSYDVIVSDARMPSMDGAELLRIVSERWPHTVRIVLSGSADLQQTLRLIPLAHQYLSKPCEAQQLENMVERCLGLHELLLEPRLRSLVGRIKRLPPVPATFAKIQQAVAGDDVSVRKVAQLVAADSVTAAKVLQMSNSAFFRLGRPITNIEQAVNYLGFNAVRNLVMSAEVFTKWSRPGIPTAIDPERLQMHAQTIAAITHALTAGTPIHDDALLAALLHDIGYWVLMQECPREIEQVVAAAVAERIPLHEAEYRVVGSSHAEIGAYLLGIWGLPYSVVEAIAHHHAPQRVTQAGFDVLAALAVASALAPVGDEDACAAAVPPDVKVGAAYLESVGAPFSWDEAERRAAESLTTGNSIV